MRTFLTLLGGYVMAGAFGVAFVQTALDSQAFQSNSGTQALSLIHI